MREFKVGEEVILVEDLNDWDEGEELTVVSVKLNTLQVVDRHGEHDLIPDRHLRHKYPNPPHERKDLIIEWAKGADIGFINHVGDIERCHRNIPSWGAYNKYIIIEPTPPKSQRELKIEELKAQMADIAKQIEGLK